MRLHSLGDYDFNEFWMTPGTSTDLIFQVGLAFIFLIFLALGSPYPGKIIAQFLAMVFESGTRKYVRLYPIVIGDDTQNS